MIGVYGANGFVGRHLVRWLVRNGLPVRAVSKKFDAKFTGPLSGRVDFVEADLSHPIAMGSSLQGIDTVVQLISTSSPGLGIEYTVADLRENVIPHVEFLHACVRAGVRRYVFLSSGGTVYGPGSPLPTPESSLTNPVNSHGLAKLTVEKYIQMHGHVDGLEYVILRVGNLFGPGQEFRKGQGIVPALIDRWKKDRSVTVFGDGQARRDYVFITDAIEAIGAALALEGSPRLILNIGGGETKSIIEVLEAIEAATGYRFRRDYIPARNTDVDISHLDISRACEVLGWRPTTDFNKGIQKVVCVQRTGPS